MDHHSRFKRSLLHLLQTKTFEQFLECEEPTRTTVEFQLLRRYLIQLTPRRIMLTEHDPETVRQPLNGRWKTLGRVHAHGGRIVLDRASGRILQTPALGLRSRARRRHIQREAAYVG